MLTLSAVLRLALDVGEGAELESLVLQLRVKGRELALLEVFGAGDVLEVGLGELAHASDHLLVLHEVLLPLLDAVATALVVESSQKFL